MINQIIRISFIGIYVYCELQVILFVFRGLCNLVLQFF